jgi:hypothetical protein
MEIVLSALIGALLGLIYNEQLYRQSLRYPKSSPMVSFWLRLLFTGFVAVAVARWFGGEGLLAFLGGNLLARAVHTLLRAFPIVRY